METQVLPKYKLHGCPKCRGDLHFEEFDNAYECLQCGYIEWGFVALPLVSNQLLTPTGRMRPEGKHIVYRKD